MGQISLLFDGEPQVNRPNVRTTYSSFKMEGVEVGVTGFSDFSTGIVKIRLTWEVRGVPYVDENLSYLRYMKAEAVKRDIVGHVKRLVRLSKAN